MVASPGTKLVVRYLNSGPPNGPNEVSLPIALALGVARLGEVELRGWWRSHGLGQAGRAAVLPPQPPAPLALP
jgi:hypothetical protein